MVRASAKNHDSVAVVVDPGRYDWVLEQVKNGGFELADRRLLAVDAFRHTATYDIAVASWMGNVLAPEPGGGPFPAWVGASWDRSAALRYGENPHQAAALYVSGAPGLAAAEQLHGKEMSYNNYVDADAAWRAAHDHEAPCVAIIKHANPCGIAVGTDIADAHRKAHATDPVSAYGGVIAANREVSVADGGAGGRGVHRGGPGAGLRRRRAGRARPQEERARAAAGRGRWPGAAPSCARSPAGCCCSSATRSTRPATTRRPGPWPPATRCPPRCWPTWSFAWRACRSVKSNAILLAADRAAVGVGMGQVNRVDAARLAVTRAGDRAPRFGGRVGRLLPVPGRPAGAASTPGCARSCSRAVRCATRR